MSAARIVFAGTPDFALASLEALLCKGHVPVAVLTQPDRPAGRGKKLRASPVKVAAADRDIPVWQPSGLRDSEVVAKLADLQPDIFVVAAYGLILPRKVLALPAHGCLNVHASLLPRWRGAAPIQHAILSGDAETGVCLMRMEAGLDTGPVYAAEATPVGPGETAGQLLDRLSLMGGELLSTRLDDILGGRITPLPQDDASASYAGKINRDDARIDWQQPAETIERQVRAYNPVPGAWFEHDGAAIKCWSAAVLAGDGGEPGTIIAAGGDGIDVACGSGVLRLLQLQRPGRGRVTAAEFARQAKLEGTRLGDTG